MNLRFNKKPEKKTIILLSAAAAVFTMAMVYGFHGKHKVENQEPVIYVQSIDSLMNPGADAGRINRFPGVVQTQKQTDIQLEQDKMVKEILVNEGDTVSVGTVLFTYDTEKEKDLLAKAELDAERLASELSTKVQTIEAAEQTGDELKILQAQTDFKQSEYEKKAKDAEIEKLKESIVNAEVKSQSDGVVKSIYKKDQQSSSGEEIKTPFMSIIAMGDYRVKGNVNEQTVHLLTEGQQVIVHSRADSDVIWKGIITEIDTKNPQSGNTAYAGVDSSMQSSSYPFYIQLESSDQMIPGQHVYIEQDLGQNVKKEGIWLDESFLLQEEDGSYVWADNGKGKLEKRKVEPGKYDEDLLQYEILKGLTVKDKIAYTDLGLKAGMKTEDAEQKEEKEVGQ